MGLILHVRDLVPKKAWSRHYEQINAFERRLVANGTQILKFFPHASKEEQLKRSKQRLEDAARHWKIREAAMPNRYLPAARSRPPTWPTSARIITTLSKKKAIDMIERLKESHGGVIGFRLIGQVTAEEVTAFEEQIEFLIAERRNRPIGIVADLSQLDSVDWKARWEEMRFLQKYTNHIARIAVIGADTWETVAGMALTSMALLQGETLYFHTSESLQAWHWARTSKHATEAPPPRQIYAATGIWKNYTPEFDI